MKPVTLKAQQNRDPLLVLAASSEMIQKFYCCPFFSLLWWRFKVTKFSFLLPFYGSTMYIKRRSIDPHPRWVIIYTAYITASTTCENNWTSRFEMKLKLIQDVSYIKNLLKNLINFSAFWCGALSLLGQVERSWNSIFFIHFGCDCDSGFDASLRMKYSKFLKLIRWKKTLISRKLFTSKLLFRSGMLECSLYVWACASAKSRFDHRDLFL